MADHFVRAASLAEIPPGQLARARIGGRRILLANVDGEIFATDELCTHEDSSLYLGALHGDCVSCTLHGSRFNVRTGEPREAPATEPLRTYPVRIEGDDVLVCVD
ncbi:non-heme iron oxygenase ferredoxin subunit [Thiohalobacter sp. IOR34]|uniref:non-heme iron oxygenase ferredoxin subunit n=1 Tax=Thiohalobacter sp. IOR34 TaxID=3057176 RepID=UPI0025B25749|nr:non-heme iron oxygenase ferredoxin subunit [Thiohalobacter sp. IOR34]WJW76101.1 non-heme iron oxygenase ferredoxin subunit [Thiohalobacter sp. IOR34]